jgi:hypothetical protein
LSRNKLFGPEGELVDHLRVCMDLLRKTASDDEGMRVYLGEKWIDQYCEAEARNQKDPLKRLLNAIHNQAEQRPSEDFWITMGEYVQARLRRAGP